MESREWVPTQRNIIKWIVLILGCFLLYSIRIELKAALSPFLFALLLTYLLAPLVDRLQQRRLSRSAAILLIYGIVILALVILGVYAIPAVVDEIRSFVQQIPAIATQVQQLAEQFNALYEGVNLPFSLSNAIQGSLEQLQVFLDKLLKAAPQFVMDFFSSAVFVVLVPILAYYMLRDLDLIKRKMTQLIPSRYRETVVTLLGRIGGTFGAWLRGQLLICLLTGFLIFVGLAAIGMDFALLLGLLVALFNIIPYFGPIIAAVPAIFLGFVRAPILGVKVLLVQVIVQHFESTVLVPTILGRQLGLHPLIIMFALFLGGQFGGIIGMLFAAPIAAILKEIVTFFISVDAEPIAADGELG